MIDGRASYTGTTTLKGSKSTWGLDTIVFTDPQPASSLLQFEAIAQGAYRFRPAGYADGPTQVSVHAFKGVSDGQNTVYLEPNQTLTVGTVSGKLTFSGPPSATLVIG